MNYLQMYRLYLSFALLTSYTLRASDWLFRGLSCSTSVQFHNNLNWKLATGNWRMLFLSTKKITKSTWKTIVRFHFSRLSRKLWKDACSTRSKTMFSIRLTMANTVLFRESPVLPSSLKSLIILVVSLISENKLT